MNMISIIFLSERIQKRNMTKLISLNAKIIEIIKINKMKNGYRDVADVKIKKIIISINIIVNDKKSE